MIYADYCYYASVYMGTTITEVAFPRLAMRASRFLDYYTNGRAQSAADTDALKLACCALAEQYQMIETAQELAQTALPASRRAGETGELQSQTVGSWSKTYRSGGDSARQALSSAQSARECLAEIARQYLGTAGLLYRGRGCVCGHVSPYGDALS